MRVFAFYPPGPMYQRGEDRCMIDIDSSTANAMRACNDLGYIASILREKNDSVFIKDYATEELEESCLFHDIEEFGPDVIILSATNATVFEDIALMNRIKEVLPKTCMMILKGAIFFDAPKELYSLLDLRNIDILIGGEVEWVIADVVHRTKPFSEIPCISFKEDGEWKKTDFSVFNDNLDSIPFPARDLMKNELYIRPDTGEPMATIQTGHGCPSNCIYCLTPHISGKKLRLRSPQNVMAELEECYYKHNIKSFFFRADTFTYNREWVLELCNLIKDSDLNGKIEYTANSRVKPLSMEVLRAMKETGCFTIAFGLETGSPETMKRIRKGVAIDDNEMAVKMAHEAGLKVFGFFMMGFPWETKNHLKETRKMILSSEPDFIEIHVALPYYGTELYEQCKESGVLGKSSLGSDIFHSSTKGTMSLSIKELMKFRSHTILLFYLRPRYILKKIIECKNNPKVFCNYVRYGIKMVKNIFLG